MSTEEYIVLQDHLSPAAHARKEQLEQEPNCRTDHMEYMEGMEQISPELRNKVMEAVASYDYSSYTDADVARVLSRLKSTDGNFSVSGCSTEDFGILLSPAAKNHIEEMAQLACRVTRAHFGNSIYLFTPLYIANYCENYCVYCGFNCYNHIHRKKLSFAEMEHEMQVIADSGIEEILMLTGESRKMSDLTYIGKACRLAAKYFRNVGLEIYPVNTDEYRYLHICGADYITVFQETYNPDMYETLHLLGHKRIWPYRFEAQERALMGGMRGVGFSALLGLDDFRRDAYATALHAYYLQKKYPHAEISLSCPRLRPIINNDKINPHDVHETELCQILCAYRLFLPFAGITVSSREQAHFRDGIIKIAATKLSAGVSTGIGDHEQKYEQQKNAHNADDTHKPSTDDIIDDTHEPSTDNTGDEQFEISDARSFEEIYAAIQAQGLQPVLNDYIYT